jgi:hypothetical protein
VDATKYGDKFKDHLIEEYKLYVQMADNVSARRSQANQFYISVLSILLAAVALGPRVVGTRLPLGLQKAAYPALTLLGVALSVFWYSTIRSYRQLNSGKFKIVHEMESLLPFECYRKEWDILGKGADHWLYLPITHVETWVPALLLVLFLVVLGFSIF